MDLGEEALGEKGGGVKVEGVDGPPEEGVVEDEDEDDGEDGIVTEA